MTSARMQTRIVSLRSRQGTVQLTLPELPTADEPYDRDILEIQEPQSESNDVTGMCEPAVPCVSGSELFSGCDVHQQVSERRLQTGA